MYAVFVNRYSHSGSSARRLIDWDVPLEEAERRADDLTRDGMYRFAEVEDQVTRKVIARYPTPRPEN